MPDLLDVICRNPFEAVYALLSLRHEIRGKVQNYIHTNQFHIICCGSLTCHSQKKREGGAFTHTRFLQGAYLPQYTSSEQSIEQIHSLCTNQNSNLSAEQRFYWVLTARYGIEAWATIRSARKGTVPPPRANVILTSGNLALPFLKRMLVMARAVSKGYLIADAEMSNSCGSGLGSVGWTNIVAFLRFSSAIIGSSDGSPR